MLLKEIEMYWLMLNLSVGFFSSLMKNMMSAISDHIIKANMFRDSCRCLCTPVLNSSG